MAKPLKETLTDIANAIREKDGTTTTMTSQEMPARIKAIPSGSSVELFRIYSEYNGQATTLTLYIPGSDSYNGSTVLMKFNNLSYKGFSIEAVPKMRIVATNNGARPKIDLGIKTISTGIMRSVSNRSSLDIQLTEDEIPVSINLWDDDR